MATEFKGESFDLKARGEAAILLASPAGKKVTVTVRSREKTDINLFIDDADKKRVAKNRSTLKVKVEEEEKPG